MADKTEIVAAYEAVAVTTAQKPVWRVVLAGKDGSTGCEVTFIGPDAKQCAEEYAELMALVRDEG